MAFIAALDEEGECDDLKDNYERNRIISRCIGYDYGL